MPPVTSLASLHAETIVTIAHNRTAMNVGHEVRVEGLAIRIRVINDILPEISGDIGADGARFQMVRVKIVRHTRSINFIRRGGVFGTVRPLIFLVMPKTRNCRA